MLSEPQVRPAAEQHAGEQPEEKVFDLTTPPGPGTLRVAFVVEGSDPEPDFRAYAVDVTPSGCHRAAEKGFLAEGRQLWLYTADGILGRGNVGRTVIGVLPPERGTGCYATRNLYGVRSRRDFVIATTHGHGVVPQPLLLGAREEAELEKLPIKLYASLKARNLGGPGSHVSAWSFGDEIVYAITVEATRELTAENEEEGGDDAGVKSLTVGRYDPRTGRDKPAAQDCGAGYVRGAFDLNRDRRVEILVDNGTESSYCEWDGNRFRKVL